MKIAQRERAELAESGMQWIGMRPKNWPIRRVSHGAELIKDQVSAEYLSGKEVWHYSIPNIQQYGKAQLEDGEEIASNKLRVREKDVLVSKLNPRKQTVTSVLKHPGLAVSSTEFVCLRARNAWEPRFLQYVFLSESVRQYLDARVESVTRSHQRVNPSLIHKFPFACPNLREQRAITAFLDHETARIDDLIAKQEWLIQLLKEKRQAVISHAVTKGLNPDAPMKDSGIEWLGEVPAHWKVAAIKRLTRVRRGASPRPIDDPKYFDDNGKYAWVRIADATASGGSLESTTQRLSPLGSSLSVKLSPGSLFLSIAGTVGLPCITKIYACIHDGFVYFPEWKGENRYLFYIFMAGECYRGLGKFGTQLNLNTDTVGWIKIPVPPDQEQFQIVKRIEDDIDRIDGAISAAARMIELLNERRAALITAAVTGKIDVRSWKLAESDQKDTAVT